MKLYLQVDNTSRENKNKYLIFFLAVLILLGYFDDVVVHFLTVGHTHDDQDAVFGILSSQKQQVHRVAYDLHDLIQSLADPTLHASQKALFAASVWVNVAGVWDWKAWMKQETLHRNPYIPQLSNHSHYRSLHLRRCPDGVRMNYRPSARPNDPWTASFEEKEGVPRAPLVANAVPPGRPAPCRPKQCKPELPEEVRIIQGALQLSPSSREWFAGFAVTDLERNPHIRPPPGECLQILRPRIHPPPPPPPLPSSANPAVVPPHILSQLEKQSGQQYHLENFLLTAASSIEDGNWLLVQPASELESFWLARAALPITLQRVTMTWYLQIGAFVLARAAGEQGQSQNHRGSIMLHRLPIQHEGIITESVYKLIDAALVHFRRPPRQPFHPPQ